VIDQSLDSVEVVHGGYGERGDTGPRPDERPGGATWIEAYTFGAGREVDAAAEHVLPSPPVQAIVAEAADDPGRGDEPGEGRRWRAVGGRRRGLGAGPEAGGDLGPGGLAGLDDDAHGAGGDAPVPLAVEIEGQAACGLGGG